MTSFIAHPNICNSEPIIIHPKTTKFLQSLDVSNNYPFENLMRHAWNNWLTNGKEEFTKKDTGKV